MISRSASSLLPAVFLIAALISLQSSQAKPTHHTVQTKYGKITGRVKSVILRKSEGNGVDKEIVSFLAVPFAQPPVGPLRFKAPQPIQAWKGNLHAQNPASPCPQPRDTTYPGFWGAEMWNYKYPPYEDCLKLNMWYPLGIKNASVLVWIFGGGFTAGSPSLDVYNGEGLAAEGDVIVINLNYRLGAFGFLYLDHPDAPGNMGLLDQQIALTWIKENIAYFGGNPNKVTLFGESAGAASVVAHMISPKSRNLFHYGILQSGSLQNPWAIDTKERAFNKSITLATRVGCEKGRFDEMTKVIRCLERTDVSKLVDSIWNVGLKYFMEFPLVVIPEDMNFFVTSEGVPFDALDYLRQGNFKQTNIMVGVNKDEGTFWMNYYLPGYKGYSDDFILTTRSEYQTKIQDVLNRERDIFRTGATWLYTDQKCTIESGVESINFTDALNQAVGDNQFTCDSLYFIGQLTKNQSSKAYLYHFTHRPSSTPWPQWMGVIHGYEIGMIFGIPLINDTHSKGSYTQAEKKLSERMIGYWKTFAETGQPAQTHEWHTATEKNRPYMRISTEPSFITENLKEKGCKYWNEVRNIEYKLRKFDHLTSSASSFSTMLLPTLLIVYCCTF